MNRITPKEIYFQTINSGMTIERYIETLKKDIEIDKEQVKFLSNNTFAEKCMVDMLYLGMPFPFYHFRFVDKEGVCHRIFIGYGAYVVRFLLDYTQDKIRPHSSYDFLDNKLFSEVKEYFTFRQKNICYIECYFSSDIIAQEHNSEILSILLH